MNPEWEEDTDRAIEEHPGRIQELEAQVRDLEAQVMALRRFAEHSEICCIWSSAFTDDAHRCSCSLLTLLAITDSEPKP